ncbi:DUF1190 domain-containing protein [Rhizobium sp. RM]|uniref:DUF1190 domain-containing protein n=1 Tax=Rhizobium sp. RM TaxID=2748079 RepID=UPI00110E5E4A|nr:DUF1190 domain-containing protein [Rhizobium sp. RM]NWJ23402.1 DUF1190 domain-containing protein [Rhizobium sp. RM]TMV14267.1 DUF1190 domain-containing protein [Rhizobium sp. Td3]
MRRRLSGHRRPILIFGSFAAYALFLHNCTKTPPYNVMFTSVDECVSSGMDTQVCQTAYQDAMQTHLTNAPRFDGMAACEDEYGKFQCTEQRGLKSSGTSGGSFTPFMTGYFLSSTIKNIADYNNYRREENEEESSSSGGAGISASQPVYRNRTGQTVTPMMTASGAHSDTEITTTRATQMVNVKTQSVSREGFGGRSFSSSG